MYVHVDMPRVPMGIEYAPQLCEKFACIIISYVLVTYSCNDSEICAAAGSPRTISKLCPATYQP